MYIRYKRKGKSINILKFLIIIINIIINLYIYSVIQF
jgi:hypothetical protein